jgi:electron transfer flavoprotein alpha subunit
MKVLVYCEVRNGKLKSTAGELLTVAKKLAGDNVHAIALGESAATHSNTIASFGAQKVFFVDDPLTNTYQNEPHIQAISELIEKEKYTLILGPASPTGKDFFPRLAARHNSALLTDCVDILKESEKIVGTRPQYAGKCLAKTTSESSVTFATVRPNVIPAIVVNQNASANAEKISPKFNTSKMKSKILEVRKGKSEKPDLTEASVIISGGRAMGNSDNFKILHEMSEVVHATVGASRAAVDNGMASHEMQVGQTGKTVNPNLYIACGISGSIQHLAGMRTSKVIVAINTDPDAPIFQKADYGIVADLFQAVPIMTKEFKALLEH